jgi:hypothetical protein
MNVGQQMALTGHVDWGEFAQGMALSLVLHGSRRVQAFQGRVTASGARGVAKGFSAVGSEPGVAATRASAYAGEMEQHAVTADKQAREPLTWIKPTTAPEVPAITRPTAEAAAEPSAPKPPEALPPVKPVVSPEPAAPAPVEPPAPRVEEHPTSAAVHESEVVKAAAPDIGLEGAPEIGPTPSHTTEVGVGDHKMYARRGPDGIEVGMCSGVCGPIKTRITEMQAAIRDSESELHGQLEELKTKASDLENRVDRGEVTNNQLKREMTDLAARVRIAAEEHPLLRQMLETDTIAGAGAARRSTRPGGSTSQDIAEVLTEQISSTPEAARQEIELHADEVREQRHQRTSELRTGPQDAPRAGEAMSPLDRPEYQESIEAARRALADLPYAPGVKTVAGTEGGLPTRSGFKPTEQFPEAEIATERAMIEGHEAGRAPDPHEFDRTAGIGESGKVRGSHAEKQAAVLWPDKPIGVSKDVCSDCQAWYQARAIERGVPQIVADPTGTRVFMPDGTVYFQEHAAGFGGPRGNQGRR